MAYIISVVIAGLLGLVVYLARKSGRQAAFIEQAMSDLNAWKKDADIINKVSAEVDTYSPGAVHDSLLRDWKRKG